MRVLFFGYGPLAVACMKELMAYGSSIDAIFTHEDDDVDSLEANARRHGIPVYYDDLRNGLEPLGVSFEGSWIVSINYRYVIPVEILKSVHTAINIHGGMLPKYRGRTPHVWAIINGEEEVGVTCHLIDEGIDSGDIVGQVRIPIDEIDTGYTILKKFEEVYPRLLMESIEKLESGFIPISQEPGRATYFGKRTPIMGHMDFQLEYNRLDRFVRALASPYPRAYCYQGDGKKILVNRIVAVEHGPQAREYIGVIRHNEEGIFVSCKDAMIELMEYEITDR